MGLETRWLLTYSFPRHWNEAFLASFLPTSALHCNFSLNVEPSLFAGSRYVEWRLSNNVINSYSYVMTNLGVRFVTTNCSDVLWKCRGVNKTFTLQLNCWVQSPPGKRNSVRKIEVCLGQETSERGKHWKRHQCQYSPPPLSWQLRGGGLYRGEHVIDCHLFWRLATFPPT